MTIPFGAPLEHLSYKDDTPEDVGLGILSGHNYEPSIGLFMYNLQIIWSFTVFWKATSLTKNE